MAKRRVNKSKLVRDYLAEHPTAGPKEVAEALSKHKISAAYVSNIKFKMTHGTGEANGKPTRRSSKGEKGDSRHRRLVVNRRHSSRCPVYPRLWRY